MAVLGQPRGAFAPKSRGVAILLRFFLGGLGIHKFYLGQAGQGLLYVLFCWTLIPAFIALIEFILLLFMSDKTFAAKYAKQSALRVVGLGEGASG